MKKSKVNQVATFEKLLSFCNTHGAMYNPSKAFIQLAALNSLHTKAQHMLKAADVSRTAYENALNARQLVFSGIPKLASRVVDALIASGASPEVIQEAGTIRRRFSSSGRVLIPSSEQTTSPDGTTEGGTYQRKLSYLDLASKVENFERLVIRVSAEPLYNPNEADLSIEGLKTFVARLRTLNRDVINAQVALWNANRLLNAVLYDTDGIRGTGVATKAYIRSVFGKGSPQHKEISSYQFNKA